MIYAKYTVIKRAYIDGKLYHRGDTINHRDGFDIRKSLKGIGDPLYLKETNKIIEEVNKHIEEIINNDIHENEDTVEDTVEDEIKRGFRGTWKLPNGDVVTGKREEAKEHWNKIKNN
jgi:hypothetical protein